MPADAPQRKDGDAFDVVLMHGPTDDGEGARVLRARPGRLDSGEVRPMREGRPLATGGEVVRLEQRPDAPSLFDVQVECTVPGAAPAPRAESHGGPAQVATPAYRDNWDFTFGARRDRDQLN
jgi:hypothetical protein